MVMPELATSAAYLEFSFGQDEIPKLNFPASVVVVA
jgi:hypothetical protein